MFEITRDARFSQNHPGRHADRGRFRGNVVENDGIGADARVVTDLTPPRILAPAPTST